MPSTAKPAGCRWFRPRSWICATPTPPKRRASRPLGFWLTFEPQGRFAYAIGDGGRVNSFSIDAQTGRLRPLPGVGPGAPLGAAAGRAQPRVVILVASEQF